MSSFGMFAPFGLLTFGTEPSAADRLYRLFREPLVAISGENDVHADATAYARAISVASLRATVKHAKNQRRPRYAVEMLPALERRFLTSPLPDATDKERRDELVAKKLVTRGARPAALIEGLTTLLGTDFLRLRIIRTPEATQFPADPGAVGCWTDPDEPSYAWRFAYPVTRLGTPFTFPYVRPRGDDGVRMRVGQSVCASVENSALVERVLITATGTNARGLPTATAVFTRSHDRGATLLTHAPVLSSNKRRVIAVVKPAAAEDPAKLAAVYRYLDQALRGTSMFAVYAATPGEGTGFIVGVSIVGVDVIGPGNFNFAGPFILGTSKLGITPMGTTAFPLD